MEAPKTLRPPSNWQDFETLCKKLWGEIWNCPEIQKNGRLGQDQSGVDIFGIPSGEESYYGIQCKGKNEYSKNQFSEKEISEEIEKAKLFEPKLKKLYLATTASNDSKTQAIVRKKNLENKAAGLFEVHLFCWEAIVDLIDENRQTHEWYVKSQNYKSSKGIEITFQNGASVITCEPKFRQEEVHYIYDGLTPSFRKSYQIAQSRLKMYIDSSKSVTFGQLINQPIISNETNHSYSVIKILIKNIGTVPIEEYKVFLDFDKNVQDISDNNVKGKFLDLGIFRRKNLIINSKSGSVEVVPKNKILVSDDIFESDSFFIKTLPEECAVKVKWRLISKDYKESGELIINIAPKIEKDIKEEYIDTEAQERVVLGSIEDFIEIE